MKPNTQDLKVEIPESLDPVFSNAMQITIKDDEFCFIFLQILPIANRARAKSIISVTPKHAKMIQAVLSKTITEYEKQNGDIKIPEIANIITTPASTPGGYQ